MSEPVSEAAFREFLRILATEEVSVEQWNRFVITRYADPHIEQGRRRLAQAALSIGQCSARPQPDRLRAFAQELLDEFD